MNVRPITPGRYYGFLRGKGHLLAAVSTGWAQQFTPFSSTRSDAPTCVIGNAIPKSGTYLINRVIEYLARWENIRIHLNPLHWDVVRPDNRVVMRMCLPRFAIRKLQNGQFVAAHLPWSRGVEQSIGRSHPDRRIKHVFMFRDPRDTFVSYMNFSTYLKQELRTAGSEDEQKYMLDRFSCDDDRLAHVIETRKSYKFLKYAPWLDTAHCHPVRFEDLYQDLRAAQRGELGPALRAVLQYLDADADTVDPVALHEYAYNRGPTATQEEDKVGQYRRVFKDRHYAQLDTPAFREVLSAFGYEW